MTLLAFLRETLETYPSVKAIKRAIDRKQCMINGCVEYFSTHRLKEGDRVEITLDLEPLPLPEILFEDDTLIAYNKPPGKITETFGSDLLVHRLDKDTSGAFLLAKTHDAKQRVAELFRERKVEKVYIALCDGVIEEDEWKIDNYLAPRVRYQGGVLYGKSTREKGKRAITHFTVLKRSSCVSLVLARPLTGRTHQIRVHLREFGHCVLGDWQYNSSFRSPLRPRRHMLHALKLTLVHPCCTGKKIVVEAPLFKDFLEMQKSLFPT